MLNVITVIVISFYHLQLNVCRLLWCVCTGNGAFDNTNIKILPFIHTFDVRVPTRRTQYDQLDLMFVQRLRRKTTLNDVVFSGMPISDKKHGALTQCFFYVGPASQTVGQH